MTISQASRGELLVAILNQQRDLDILRKHGWYRIPVVSAATVSYTHLRAHETDLALVCRLLLETKHPPPPHPHSDPSCMTPALTDTLTLSYTHTYSITTNIINSVNNYTITTYQLVS